MIDIQEIHDPRSALDDDIHPGLVWDDWCGPDPLSQVCVLFEEIDRLREGLERIARYYGSAEQCREIAQTVLEGKNDES